MRRFVRADRVTSRMSSIVRSSCTEALSSTKEVLAGICFTVCCRQRSISGSRRRLAARFSSSGGELVQGRVWASQIDGARRGDEVAVAER